MKWEFALDLKKTILLGFCLLLLSGLLILMGYLYGLMSGAKTAGTGSPPRQTAQGAAGQTTETAPSQNTVRQTVAVPEKAESPPVKDKPDKPPAAPLQPKAAPATPPPAAQKDAPPQSNAPATAKTNASDANQAPPKDEAANQEKKDGSPAPENEEAASAAQPADASPEADQAPSPEAQTVPWKEGYTVQVGSFTIEDNALEMIHKILEMNYPAYMYLYTDSKGGIWYVVQVGRYDSRDKATETAVALRNKEMIALVKPITESIRQKRKAFRK